MNLTQFIEKVDSTVMNLNQEKMAKFIHNIARNLPKNQRDEFLEKLQDMEGSAPLSYKNHLTEEENIKEIKKRLCQIQEELLLIENGELRLIGVLNEEYDDWYNSSADEFIFEDPENISEIIEKACNLIHQCVDYELYEEGYELADMFIALEIMVECEYYDIGDSPLSLKEIEEHELSLFNYRQLIIEALYIAYWANPLEERPGALYRMIYNSRCHDITLEELIQEGKEELDRLPEFLKLWLWYLGTCNGDEDERLLSEAVALQSAPGQALEAARKFSVQHPGLYEQVLKQNLMNGGNEEQFNLGKEALSAIPSQFRVRSRVALLTAAYALHLKRQNEAELCWMEAFRSDTSVVNYLRMVVGSLEFARYREEARTIYHNCYEISNKEGEYNYRVGELSENRIEKQTYFTLAFFGGEFRHVIEEGMNEQKALGWSYTFMKMGIALFLLYLYKEEDMPAGCRNMCNKVCESIEFTSDELSQGLDQPLLADNTSLFWECFCKWKRWTSMSVTEEQYIIKKLEDWIRIRVEGIMQGNYRRYYGECAAFIAALGEVKVSRGEMNGKAKLMETYRAAYSRRTAFHKELKAFGMK